VLEHHAHAPDQPETPIGKLYAQLKAEWETFNQGS
jgi:hypothetical protein